MGRFASGLGEITGAGELKGVLDDDCGVIGPGHSYCDITKRRQTDCFDDMRNKNERDQSADRVLNDQ